MKKDEFLEVFQNEKIAGTLSGEVVELVSPKINDNDETYVRGDLLCSDRILKKMKISELSKLSDNQIIMINELLAMHNKLEEYFNEYNT